MCYIINKSLITHKSSIILNPVLMKKYIILAFFMLSSLGFAVAQNVINESNNQNTSKNSTVPVTYTCPMHHEINTDKPGKCPKCGMALVLKSSAPYSCPMHPKVTSMEPGKCSICGMKLQKTKAKKQSMPMNHGNMHQGHSM